MDQLSLIKATHEVDQHLSQLAGVVKGEDLKGRILAVQEEWRTFAFDITAELCGAGTGDGLVPVRRRGRRKKTEEPVAQAAQEDGEQR